MLKYIETIFISFLKEIYGNISKNWGMFFAAITVISFSFFVLQLIILVYYNMENFKNKILSQITIHVYLKSNVQPQQISDFMYNLDKNENVLSATLISKEEMKKRIKDELNITYSDLPLGSVVYVKVKNPEFVKTVSEGIKKEKIVKDVIYWQEYAEKIGSVFDLIKKILFVVIVILALGVILIINNTVKMSILSRKNEIKIMNLVGASGWFIKAPLFAEIFIVLILSSFISHYFIRIGYGYLMERFNNFVFFNLLPIDYLIFVRNMLIFTSIIISFLFVYSTIEKYLKKLAEDE